MSLDKSPSLCDHEDIKKAGNQLKETLMEIASTMSIPVSESGGVSAQGLIQLVADLRIKTFALQFDMYMLHSLVKNISRGISEEEAEKIALLVSKDLQKTIEIIKKEMQKKASKIIVPQPIPQPVSHNRNQRIK